MLTMSTQSPGRSEIDRQHFVADSDALAALGLAVEDLDDPDLRALVIRQEHPEFEDALRTGLREIDLGSGPMNPRLHLAMHEIVATQLWDDSPTGVWETAVRLLDVGYERHEILHMLGRPVLEQIWAALHEKLPYDRERHVVALRALPGSWEEERGTLSSSGRDSDAREQDRRKAKAARRRNRRPS
jgi:hypothetical protein